MKIIKVPLCTDIENLEIYTAWRKEVKTLLGVDLHVTTGNGPWEFVWRRGRLFRRTSSGVFFYLAYNPRGFCENKISVLCRCGNTTFKLQLPGYECLATCSKCGKEEVVYDG